MRADDGVPDRPNDQRGFLHKKILGGIGKVLGVAGGVIPLPGAGILRFAGEAARSFSQSGRPVQTVGAPPPSRFGVGSQASRFPSTRGPLETQGAAKQFAQQFQAQATTNGCPPEAKVCAPRGFHLNKSSYFLRDGTFVARESRFVRNRRLNNANGRAQDKAIVRLEKGQDHAKKLLKATGWRTISKMSSREMRNAKKAVCK